MGSDIGVSAYRPITDLRMDQGTDLTGVFDGIAKMLDF
jgi:hypothetical protein